MKSNKIMRCASALLAVALLSTCAISGTFAKYVTSTTGGDNARVAHWGFNEPATVEIDLFSNKYDNVLSNNTVDGIKNVIAPGTSQTSTFGFNYDYYAANAAGENIGAPEVNYKLTVDPTITGNYDGLDENASFKWTLQKDNGEIAKYNTAADLIAAVKALSGDESGTCEYAAGNQPTFFNQDHHKCTVGWIWDFEGADEADTALGNAQGLDLENVTFKITITAEQVD